MAATGVRQTSLADAKLLLGLIFSLCAAARTLRAPVAIGLVLARRRLPFSATSWILVVSFLALHEVGSHYTYSRVPWMEWSRDLLGWAPGWERNHYDRFLHLAFGLLLRSPFGSSWPHGSMQAPRFFA